jgi:hypothetical protein
LKVKQGKFGSKDKIDEVINVPNKLLTPYQTMITPPDNDDETKNTLASILFGLYFMYFMRHIALCIIY